MGADVSRPDARFPASRQRGRAEAIHDTEDLTPFFFSNLLEMGGSTDVAGSAAQLRMEAVSADSSIHRSRKGLSAIIRDQMALTGV